jgi:hypothetical protein
MTKAFTAELAESAEKIREVQDKEQQRREQLDFIYEH